jgi:hypothetical protein
MSQSDSKFEEFRAGIRPTVSVINDLASAVAATAERHHRVPSEQSRAMREIHAQASTYGRHTSWDEPITDTHSFGGMILFAAIDYAHTFASSLAADRTPVYGHLVVARSLLESAVIASWLNKPDVEPDERVRRGLCEQIYNAWELVRLGIEEDANERVTRWMAVAEAFEWDVKKNNGKPTVGNTSWPSIPMGVDELVGTHRGRLGRAQWSYLSAVSHGTWYGLRQAVASAPIETAFGGSLADFGTKLTDVWSQAIRATRALRGAAHARFTLMGWIDAEWREACRLSETHENSLLAALQKHWATLREGGSSEPAAAL